MDVPFVDLKSQFRMLKSEIMPGIEDVLTKADLILGGAVQAFEREFAAFCGASECVSVATGCDALAMSLKAIGIAPGDEVLVPTNTFIATALAISACGARPVLVDCDPETYQIDVKHAEAAVTRRTRAILPVHLYGHPADMAAVMALAVKHNLLVVEDACQAHGATFHGKTCGTMGGAAGFSFYPGKNLGAYGDGGAVVTNRADVATAVRMARNYGQSVKYHHEVVGWNSRLDTIQAVVLLAKLRYLERWNRSRSEHAAAYRARLKGLPLTLPIVKDGCTHVYHLFVVQCDRRDALMEFLKGRGIQSGIHYPIPIHLQKAYAGLGYKAGSFPVAERIAGRLVSLPMFPEMTEAQIDWVCQSIHAFFGRG